MRFEKHGHAFLRTAIVAGVLVLTGCVPSAYVYDDLPDVHYGSGGVPHAPAHHSGYPGYYGYQGFYSYQGYYGYPGYYRDPPRPPRVVYYDHDHRGDDCRHESHRDGRWHDDRHDRSPPAGPRVGPPARRPPPPRDTDAQGPGSPPHAPGDRDRCGGRRCGPSVTADDEAAPRGMRALRAPGADDRDTKSRDRREPD